MTDNDFHRLGKFIEQRYGIKMPSSKKFMVQARLQKRLHELEYEDFNDYINYIFSPQGRDEILRMIDEVTTNKTEFFREADQFEALYELVLPEIIKGKQEGAKNVNIWSAGCSTGEEPYSIAMICSEFFSATDGGFDYQILATDLSQKVLDHARQAIYYKKDIAAIPLSLRKKYLLKSKKQPQEVFRIIPEIRSKVEFKQHNLIKKRDFMDRTFDIIFCRNVIIYFDKSRQTELFKKFHQYLNPGGFLFIGHSETLMNSDVPFELVKPKIYRKG